MQAANGDCAGRHATPGIKVPRGRAITTIPAGADSAGRGCGFCRRQSRSLQTHRQTCRHQSHQGHPLRMRYACRRRRSPADVGEVLSRGDALHPIRHRGDFPLPVGRGLQRYAGDQRPAYLRLHDFVHRHLARWLYICRQEEGI